ncbi:hypothetical protein PSC71_17085 [Devosia sp. J2-20]|uniref:Choice-of-anchor G family protein n=1 Tax=Devosia litorisediminis TaxID=2829817 RepID=A0A942I5I6_9HYPH|nr:MULTISPECIES: hypothetical protein [Devosia]MBS3848017.1 hypothetical protein [Devosia litorisediminis]WDQ98883.1 hypothetical protein PSC71_17085 [Devosia sp. J2-20]
MPTKTSTKRRLGAIATACLLSVALPTAPAWAQKTKTKPGTVAEASTSQPAPSVSVDVPTINALSANVDEATLRDILSGNLIANADALASLTATSITIPTIRISITDSLADSTIVLENIVLEDVTDGVATTASVGGMTVGSSTGTDGHFGEMSAKTFDIGGLLRFYGVVDGGGQTEMKTIYSDFVFAGGSFTAPDVTCTIGAATATEFKARPISMSFAEIMALSTALEQQDEAPSPEILGKLMRTYADMLTAIESSPVKFDGFDCDGTDDKGNPVNVSVAGMTMGGMSPGIYPSIDLTDMAVEVTGDGSITIGSLSFKEIDLSAPIAAIQNAPDALDDDWFEANLRALIPAFAGFSIGDVAIDIPDPETPGGRLVASIGAFDLSLGDYLNGIPTNLLTTASNLKLDLPADTSDEQLQLLMALGISSIDAGFTLDANWNEAENAIAINEVSVTGVDLATVTLAGTINNATDALFSSNENMMMAAAMGLAVGDLKLDVDDTGLSDIIMTMVAADQGSDAATMRPIFAGLAEGTVVGMLAGAAEAQKVAGAVSAFVSGKAKRLTIDVVAKQAPGLGMMDFMAAQDDPVVLLGKVNIDASN